LRINNYIKYFLFCIAITFCVSCSGEGGLFGDSPVGTNDTAITQGFFGENTGDTKDTPKNTTVIKPVDTISSRSLSERLLDASVTVYVYDKNKKPIQLGSGVFVQSNIIATNFHVIEGGRYYCVERGAGVALMNAEIYKFDETHDVALLKIEENFPSSVLSLNTKLPEPGIDIMVAGSPMALTGTLSKGIVSAIRSFPPYDHDLIQISASISQGSSGGPVVNAAGEILGITVSNIGGQGAQNLNFAVPAKYIQFLLP
jgi:S1-C subfamily serine protease